MALQFTDALELGKPRRTKEGYMAVRARAARAGVYDYLGREVDPEGRHFAADQVVKVYRPESEVFATDAVHSFLMKPITDDHPSVAVTADNWKTHAKGVNAGALRDGQYLAFDLVIMDRSAIEAVDAGKKQLSNGYGCEVEIGDGVAPDGTAYQATQRALRGNHVALVRAGRAGPECRIGDASHDGGNRIFESCDAATVILAPIEDQETNTMPHTLIIDGLQVPNVSDEAKAAIEKLQGQTAAAIAAKDAAETTVAALTADKAGLEVKVTALEQAVKDAKVTPAQLRDAAKAYDKLVADAKRLAPAFTITDAMDEPAIRKGVVAAKLGDRAKDYDDAAVSIAFDTLAAQLGDATTGGGTTVITAPLTADADKAVQDARAEMLADLRGEKKAA
jgi:hypothetical protein